MSRNSELVREAQNGLWESVSADEQVLLNQELEREIDTHHLLFGIEMNAVAKHKNSNNHDYVFAASDGRIAYIHLTWSGEKEREKFPHSSWFESTDAKNFLGVIR